MMINYKSYGFFCAAIMLAGCGGGGTTAFEALDNKGDAILSRSEALFGSEGYTDPGTLPSSTTATYQGVIGFVTFDESLGVLGDLELTADFNGPGSITGSATNFVDETNNSYEGTLSISNGVIDRLADTSIDFTYSADIDGPLTDATDTYLVDGILEGDFIGDANEFTEGFVDGTVSSTGGTIGFLGVFVAER